MASVQALGTPQHGTSQHLTPHYTPRLPGGALARIVEDHLDELRQCYDERFARTHGPLTARTLDLFERFLRCGDPHFGFLRLRCEDCAHERLLPFSCKARGLCPSCGKRRSLQWAERMVEDVLPEVPYAPLVFTIPKILRPAFLFRPELYGDLCRAAYRVVREALEARFSHLNQPVPAFLASSQSFGSLLNFHPHVHALVSRGVFEAQVDETQAMKQGSETGTFHPTDDFDFSTLELPFRDAMLKVLEKQDAIDEHRATLIRSWQHSGFRVHSERIIQPGSRAELESILQYMERAPVSPARLTTLDTGMVHYQGRYHPGLGRDHQLVTGVEFLALLVPHIQHRYQCKIRTYGALSTTLRKRFGWIEPAPTTPVASPANSDPASMPDDADSEFTQRRKRGWAHFIRKVWIDDPELCEKCGGAMKIVAALSSPEQDDVIRSILESTGQWDPPWSRRAPPTKSVAGSSDAAEPIVECEVDPDQLWSED